MIKINKNYNYNIPISRNSKDFAMVKDQMQFQHISSLPQETKQKSVDILTITAHCTSTATSKLENSFSKPSDRIGEAQLFIWNL